MRLDKLGAISFCDMKCRKKLLGGSQVMSPCLDWLTVGNSIFCQVVPQSGAESAAVCSTGRQELPVRGFEEPLCSPPCSTMASGSPSFMDWPGEQICCVINPVLGL